MSSTTTTTTTTTTNATESVVRTKLPVSPSDESAESPHTIKLILHQELTRGIPQDTLPEHPGIPTDVPHAPTKDINRILKDKEQVKMALRNALRYFPQKFHKVLAKEFYEELKTYGHIYMYRFRPKNYEVKAYPLDYYPGNTIHAKAIMFMIMNNLDKEVAQYPCELVTYGGNGSVFNNWAQYLQTMKYLSQMNDEQTLSMYSGHPMGLFPSHSHAPRVVISNGMTIPNYSTSSDYEQLYAMGNTIFGQMTAGSYCYIGPQGIVHGTTTIVQNAGRKYLGLEPEEMNGKVFVSAGLGGMSGAQAKAGAISNMISVIAEVNIDALEKRYKQGWINEKYDTLDALVDRIRELREKKVGGISIAYHGNVVDVWERLAETKDELLVDLGSDQTSLHLPFNGGYYPVHFGSDIKKANQVMKDDPDKFKELVQESLRRQVEAINMLTQRGMKFWDYGNSFLFEASSAGAKIFKDENKKYDSSGLPSFKYPSYVQDIMGEEIFSYGFGPFRWVVLSNDPKDLLESDKIAAQVMKDLQKEAPKYAQQQYKDNIKWIEQADDNKLVVGSQARILYSDGEGRRMIAKAFNNAIKEGRISAPIVISRDHHDVSGADSPFRETSNLYDGSNKCADMAVQTVIGNATRGATYVALHNGGGTGWGKAVNCGFGLVLDGTKEAELKSQDMLLFDVYNGIARRSWSLTNKAQTTMKRGNGLYENLDVLVPDECEEDVLDKVFEE